MIPRRDRTKLDIDPSLEAHRRRLLHRGVRQQVAEKYGEGVLYGGGLRIYVTLDLDMQRAAWDAVTSHARPARRSRRPPSWRSTTSGQVKAMVGGRDFDDAEGEPARSGTAGGGSGRGAGSSFKPFVLAAAVRQGISLNSKFNAPAEITLPRANNGEDWVVHNYGDDRAGHARPRRRHPRVVQHRLRAADARGRARTRGRPGPRHGRRRAELPRSGR